MLPSTLSSHAPVSADIRRASRGEAGAIAAPLADAFFDDPVFAWITPDEARRRPQLSSFFRLFAETLVVYGESYLAPGGDGSAIWVPPRQPPVPDASADAFVEQLALIAGPDGERLFEAMELVDEHHPHGSFYFLQFVGVVSGKQGRGIGSALLSQMLERCDREGVPAYLDATSPRNKALYERHAFRVVGEFAPIGGPTFWQMWREPGA
jgi:ribosomal protein S18 acetylase RimI-like enzyme